MLFGQAKRLTGEDSGMKIGEFIGCCCAWLFLCRAWSFLCCCACSSRLLARNTFTLWRPASLFAISASRLFARIIFCRWRGEVDRSGARAGVVFDLALPFAVGGFAHAARGLPGLRADSRPR